MKRIWYWPATLGLILLFSVVFAKAGSDENCLHSSRYQSLSAHIRCSFPQFFSSALLEERYSFDPATLDNPDLDVAYIMQTPRYAYDAPKNQHAPGDLVTFTAKVVNYGSQPTGTFDYAWYIDDILVTSGDHPGLSQSDKVDLQLSWIWESDLHTVRLELDPTDAVTEVSEQNNSLTDRTSALAVGFWVEQSVYDYFNTNQVTLGLGSVSWEDWAQRQLRVWNQMFAGASSPLTPAGVIDRVRLDKVTIVPDGALPSCATNYPDTSDKTIDLQWGFPAELVGISSGHACGHLNYYFDNPESQNIEYSLMHELSHARYLIDLYGLNMYVNGADLAVGVDAGTSTLVADRNVENDSNFSTPVYLAVDGELIICSTKSGSAFTTCTRGAEGTTPRSHPAGTRITLAVVRVPDGQGNLVQGSAALPVLGPWDDHLYYNRYPDDLMNGGLVYEQHSAYAWNRIAGQRPVCGNYNAPCNIGEYLNDIPSNNILAIQDLAGQPLVGAQVEVYQGQPFPLWYGRYFASTPDLVLATDEQGRVNLGDFPFDTSGPIVHTYGHSNALLLLKIMSGSQVVFRFFEVTEANEAYWSGFQDTAIYTLVVDIPQNNVLYVDKSGDQNVIETPTEIHYTYGLTTYGADALENVGLTDDRCAPVIYSSGDVDVDSLLDPEETWAFTCSQVISATMTNIVTATGTVPGGDPIYANDSWTVVLGSEQLFLPTMLRQSAGPGPLLALHFEGTFDGEDGETGTAIGVSFEQGHTGQGALFDGLDRLYYGTAGNIRRESGSVEFWLQPTWDGDDGGSYVLFEVGDSWFNRLRIMKDGANNFRFMVWSATTEYGVAYNVSDWQAGEWHHVRVVWGGDEISLYLDGHLRGATTGVALPDHLASNLYIGSTYTGDLQAEAVIDEVEIN